ncbi:NAD(P)H-binding protein [uncultured Agrococcus sp.]|uniref:NAD(P)H-binding protein n=1 Tax=uncultured Agrococcus sp. TaxID=382258 RepID=UPI0025EC609F|nr:NAD(P)H-binding protein [uncultured Agrococcus sp.]
MTIGVMTPNGHVGTHVLRQLVQAGERPRALLRDPRKLHQEIAGSVDAAVLDAWTEDTVLQATRGLEAVYWVSPTAMDRDPLAAHADAARNFRNAIETNQIERVVFQSSVGAEHRQGVGEIDGLAVTELQLEASGASVTHLRCGYFFTNLLMDLEAIRGGALSTSMDIDQPLAWVAPADIATVATGRLLSRAWSGREVQAVHGPEDLTFTQVASMLSAVLGIPVEARQLGDDDVWAALRQIGMLETQIEAIVMMAAGIRDLTHENPRTYETTTPTTLHGWAMEHLS